MNYPEEVLNTDYEDEDDGTMPNNVDTLRQAVVGHKIVKAEKISPNPDAEDWNDRYNSGFQLTLDDGSNVRLRDTDDCCAYTSLDDFFLNVENIDHVITGVGTTDKYTKWHIYADLGDIVELKVGWSSGNPFYYGYGFDIYVDDKELTNQW